MPDTEQFTMRISSILHDTRRGYRLHCFTVSSPPFQEAELAGEDYDRVKLLDVSAADLERKERKLNRKKNPDPGFSGKDQ